MTQVLDIAVVEELLSLGDDAELLLDLIEMFHEDGPERVGNIEQAFAAGDLEGVAEVAHSLKSSAGNLGIHALEADCQTLQVAGQGADTAAVTAAIPVFLAHFEEAMAALAALEQQHRR